MRKKNVAKEIRSAIIEKSITEDVPVQIHGFDLKTDKTDVKL